MIRAPIRKVLCKRAHICFHQPWGFKHNSYVIEKVPQPQTHYNAIADKHVKMAETGFYEIAAMNGHIFRTQVLYSEKEFDNLSTRCKKLFERLQKDGNDINASYHKNGRIDEKNGVLALVSLSEPNNNTQYMLRVMDDL